MSNWNWSKFVEATQNRQPVGYLMEAVEILGPIKGRALDIGCGSGVDSKYLADNGFQVEAVDINETSIEQTKKLCADLSVSIFQKDIVQYNIVLETYHLIIAWNILSFLTKDNSQRIVSSIQDGLVKGGLFVFSFFGPDDDWVKIYSEMSFWTIEELKNLLSKMNFIKVLEEKQRRPGAVGQIKFWHVIRGIAQKKT